MAKTLQLFALLCWTSQIESLELARANRLRVVSLKGSRSEIQQVSELFVRSFYTIPPDAPNRLLATTPRFGSSTRHDDDALSPALAPADLSALLRKTTDELMRGYGPLRGRGADELEAAMLVAFDDSASGQLVGCVGIEQSVQFRDAASGKEQLLSGAAGARAMNEVYYQEFKRGRPALAARVRPTIANVAVAPEARRRGVGAALLDAAEARAAAWGHGEALLIVDETNRAAQRFYARRGYRSEGAPFGGSSRRIVGADDHDAGHARGGQRSVAGLVVESVPVEKLLLRKSLRGGGGRALGWFNP